MSNGLRSRRRSLTQIFAMPLALGVVSAIGLVVALVGDDLWDVLGWLGLGIPLIITTWCMVRARHAG